MVPKSVHELAWETLFKAAKKSIVDIRPRRFQEGEYEIVVESNKGDVSSIKDLVDHGTPAQLIERLAAKRG